MEKGFEMKYEDNNKLLDFKLKGFSEKSTLNIIKEMMKLVTNSEPKKITKSYKITKKSLVNINDTIKELHINEESHPKILEQDEIINDPSPIEDKDATELHVLNNPDNDTFQTFYMCKCGDKGKHKIKRSQIYVNCRRCGKRMRVRDAHMEGFPLKDDYGNTFIAGEFKRSDEVRYGIMI